MSENHAEAKIHRRLDNTAGIYITFLIHPQDAASLDGLRIGASVQLAWAEIVNTEVEKIELPDNRAANGGDAQASPRETKQKRKFSELSLAAQAGMRCDETAFEEFFDSKFFRTEGESLADAVRRYCGVTSRSEFATNHKAADNWRDLEIRYQNWLTERRYAESIYR